MDENDTSLSCNNSSETKHGKGEASTQPSASPIGEAPTHPSARPTESKADNESNSEGDSDNYETPDEESESQACGRGKIVETRSDIVEDSTTRMPEVDKSQANGKECVVAKDTNAAVSVNLDTKNDEIKTNESLNQACGGVAIVIRDHENNEVDSETCKSESSEVCAGKYVDESGHSFRSDDVDVSEYRHGGTDNSETASLEHASANSSVEVITNGAENTVQEGGNCEQLSSNNGELNVEVTANSASVVDVKAEEDKETTGKEADKPIATVEALEKQPRQWGKQEVQDLLIKAINFRASIKDVQTILRCGVNVNAPVKNGLFPLHYAAYVDNDACVEVLLNAGANVNATDDIGYTPLHLCARRGNHRTMAVLIDNGSIINFNEPDKIIRNTDEKNKLGFTTTEPLNLAVQNNYPKCAKLLLEHGARANNKYFMGTEICLAPLDEVECLELLLQHGADPNVFNRCGLSPLMKACKDHHIPAVRTLIKYGADINAICPPLFEQKSVLQFAIISGNIVIVNILLQRGAIIKRQGEYNFSALHTAVIKGRSDICRILLQYQADVSETTAEGATALMLACSTPDLKDRKEIVQLLIDCGADVNAFSPYYSFFDPYLAPLTEYLKNIEDAEELNIVELLVHHGAEVHFSSSGLDRELRRLRDPFSILPYCHCLEKYPDLFHMLINLANKYCPLLIHANEKLSEEKKDALLYIATRPRELKHLVRTMLRQKLSPGLPENVEQLPLPAILKTYILVNNDEKLDLKEKDE